MSRSAAKEDSAGSIRCYCYRCGNTWYSDGEPTFCPRCRTSMWNVPIRRQARCIFCGHEWTLTSIDEPCPACGRARTDAKDPDMLHCNQCDYMWKRRGDGEPKFCPACRSTKWNDKRMHQFTCRRCGHVWRNRTEHPKKCPNCQSSQWNEPVYRLQCRRCGYKWTTRGGHDSDSVKMCPRCKSRKWNQVPEIKCCSTCGRMFVSRSKSDEPRCPECSHRAHVSENSCSFCGAVWNSAAEWMVCPVCGKEHDASGDTFTIWDDGSRLLRYVLTDGMAFIYLWEGSVPVATMYFKDLLNRMGVTAVQMAQYMSDPGREELWMHLADQMYAHRDDWNDNVDYLQMRLNLTQMDARILAIHFTGMGPEAIALHFGMNLEDVRRSFDRIMAAFVDCGIVVDDSIFTDDAMSMY